MSSRALRRHHRQRIWQKRRHYYSWGANSDRKRMLINTPKLCNCVQCSRKKWRKLWGELPIQERRALLATDAQLVEWKEHQVEKRDPDDRLNVSGVEAVQDVANL